MTSSESGEPRTLSLPWVEARHETPTVTTFRFTLGGGTFAYRPGQYVAARLEGVKDPRGPQRPLTLSSSPIESGFIAVTTRLTGSPFKLRLASLRIGDELRVRGPLGSFVLAENRPAVMLAGGIGITPFRSMIRHAADAAVALPMSLVYSNPVPEEIAFREELNVLAAKLGSLRVIHTITRPEKAGTGWKGKTGRIDAEMIRDAASGLDRPAYYLCGPPAMVDAMLAILREEIGIPAPDVRAEKFSGY